MDLVVITDVGRDPDDFFTLCWLAPRVNLKAIIVHPGDPDQIAVAKLICKEYGLNIPVAASKANRDKLAVGNFHRELLNKYHFVEQAKSDGLGEDVLKDVFDAFPEMELFVSGPPTSAGILFEKNNCSLKRATMQGGFCPYNWHRPKICLPHFEGQQYMATFNLNGDRKNGEKFLNANIKERRMVGKNVCHTVLFNKEIFDRRQIKNHLFDAAAEIYFQNHSEKKFHDPTAACCHLHPEIGTWIKGKTTKMATGWTTTAGEDLILADIDYEKLWFHLLGIENV